MFHNNLRVQSEHSAGYGGNTAASSSAVEIGQGIDHKAGADIRPERFDMCFDFCGRGTFLCQNSSLDYQQSDAGRKIFGINDSHKIFGFQLRRSNPHDISRGGHTV